MKKKILVISARNFGDAIVTNYLIDRLSDSGKYIVDVLTKKQHKEIFDMNPGINRKIYAEFPIASFKTFNFIPMLKEMYRHGREYDIALDVMGDFRERCILYGFRAGRLLSVERDEDNPFNNLIRRGCSFLIEPVRISKEEVNIYDQIDSILQYLGIDSKPKIKEKKKGSNIIGIHPFASQECRMWQWEKWQQLTEKLIKSGKKVIFFCSPKERVVLEKYLNGYNVDIISGSLKEFINKVAELDLMICLDSFAYHAAYYVGTKSVMLNGGNNYHMWQTRDSDIVTARTLPKCWPCYNRPLCREKECINNILADDVLYYVFDENNQ